ncbi:MAG: hypothetical protein GTN40_05045 [Candidatus Aenigmarchaeota archaeon]|nr:hypothetical protein [Candidatus Aenigmarchaeota archaeon]
MKKIIYKKATIKDLEDFFKFFTKSIKEYFSQYTKRTQEFFIKSYYSAEYFRNVLKNKEILFLAKSGRKIVGYFLLNEKPYGGVWFSN